MNNTGRRGPSRNTARRNYAINNRDNFSTVQNNFSLNYGLRFESNSEKLQMSSKTGIRVNLRDSLSRTSGLFFLFLRILACYASFLPAICLSPSLNQRQFFGQLYFLSNSLLPLRFLTTNGIATGAKPSLGRG